MSIDAATQKRVVMRRNEFDIGVIGAGIVGAAAAYQLRDCGTICILEKNEAACMEASGNNSSVLHPGFNHPPGSLKGRLCVRGNALLYEYCRSKRIPHIRCGTYVLAMSRDDEESLERLRENALDLGVELQVRMPEHRHASVRSAVFAPAGGIVDVSGLCGSLIAESGADLRCGYLVREIRYTESGWQLVSDRGTVRCQILVNAAGLYSDEISAMSGYPGYRIFPCAGEYYEIEGWQSPHLFYPAPNEGPSLGLHLSPTLRGTTLIGPTAAYISSKNDPARYTKEDEFRDAAELMFPGSTSYPVRMAHRGIRPKLAEKGFRDFVIRKEDRPLVQLIGIESPGLTSCLAIGEVVREALM